MTKKTLRDMIKNQYNLNVKTNGEGWVFGLTNKGKIINWPRTIYLETGELVDSYAWKHWKGIYGKNDIDNIKIEVSDIWHFVMSYQIHIEFILSLNYLYDSLKEESSMKEKLKDHKYGELINNFINFKNGKSFSESVKTSEFFFEYVEEKVIEFFMKIYEIDFKNKTIIEENIVSYFMKKTEENINLELFIFEKINAEATNASLYEAIHSSKIATSFMKKYSYSMKISEYFFFAIKHVIEIDLEKIYLGKNILNSFRQDNGYKEGTYKKHWGKEEIEDNRIMLKLLDDISDITELYNELRNEYSK